MDDGRKFSIPLDSPLDVNAGDMLVPVSNPKFSVNRQKYLGSAMQNSFRYESDGVVAGWLNHTFTETSSGNSSVTPPMGDPSQLYVLKKTSEQGLTTYTVQQRDINVEFMVVFQAYTKWYLGSGTVTRSDDDTVAISGTSNKGAAVVATIGVYDGALRTFSSSDPNLQAQCDLNGGLISFKASRVTNTAIDFITLRKGAPATFQGATLAYSKAASTNSWGDMFTMSDSFSVSVKAPYQVVSASVSGQGTFNEVVNVTVANKGVMTYNGKAMLEASWNRIKY